MPDELTFDWDEGNVKHIARHRVEPLEAEQAIRNEPFDMGYEIGTVSCSVARRKVR
jgi:hypothetical protein